MEEIESELEQKSVERVTEEIQEVEEEPQAPEPPKKKTKKVRSEAQKAAFERAKLKRAENIKKRKEEAAQKKLEKKVVKTQIKERVKEELQKQGSSVETEQPQEKPVTGIPAGPMHTPPLQRQTSVRDNPQGSSVREQVVQNHYYYYGMPPPQESQPQKSSRKKKGKKVKRPPTPPTESSSEEESDVDEPETYQEQYKAPEPEPVYYEQPKKPKFKFNYV